MARLTIEDCLDKVPNCYSLVLLASKRARQLSQGVPVLVEDLGEKATVLALREIAAGKVSHDNIDSLVSRPAYTEPEPDDPDAGP